MSSMEFYEVDQLIDSDDVELLNKNFKISNLSEMFTFDKKSSDCTGIAGNASYDSRVKEN